ncbi:RimK family alpha-L-glutamate ligase [Streptomyces goshikiensis]|uniref:ATP-grasp domain-containing protein n=1 Tax=Streptomyces goshikiensis TaxID=1942 RepID=UPI0036A52F4B
MRESFDLLRMGGAAVTLVSEDDIPRMANAAGPAMDDLYYIKTVSEPVFSYAGVVDAIGATTVNRYTQIARVHNRFIAGTALLHANLPVPLTWLAMTPEEVMRLVSDGPVILKPNNGSRGRNVHTVRRAADLMAVRRTIKYPCLVQRYHASDGIDRKLYCIGDYILGVKRPGQMTGDWTEKLKVSQPFTPDSYLTSLISHCQKVSGLEILGIDVVIDEPTGTPYIVDINPCPGFIGAKHAARILCDFLLDKCRAGGAWSGSRM